MKPELSIVIAYHQEGQAFIEEAITQIKETIDIDNYEIIVVDDASKPPMQRVEGVKVLRQKKNLGVGQALRRGIWEAQSENVWFQGSDIRFIPNGWASKMLKEINAHPKALSAATCIGINKDDMDIASRRNRSRRNGANIIFFHDHITHPKKPANYRNILEAQWLPVLRDATQESREIPCILGAAYGAKKEWMQYIDIWWGHRSWGTLEPYCSLSSWLMGGSCRTVPSVEIGHIFKAAGVHGTPFHHLMYNKMLVATLLFDEYHAQRLIQFLGTNPQVNAGKQMFDDEKKEILKKRAEYEKKIVYDVESYVKKWNIDFRQG